MKKLLNVALLIFAILIFASYCTGQNNETNEKGSILCGNGELDLNEKCDDGNTTCCDGCSPVCLKEDRTKSRGVVLTGYGRDAYDNVAANRTLVERIDYLEFTDVAVLVTFYADAAHENMIAGIDPDRTPSTSEVVTLLDQIKHKGMRPWLFFYIDDINNPQKWRGEWQPSDPAQTLESFFAATHEYYETAFPSGSQVAGVVVGSELIWADTNPGCASVWLRNAHWWWSKGIRRIGYSMHTSNVDNQTFVRDEIMNNYEVGISYWYDSPTRTEIHAILVEIIKWNPGIFIGEMGFPATADCRTKPWEYPGDREDFNPYCQSNAIYDFLSVLQSMKANAPGLWYWRVEPSRVTEYQAGTSNDYGMAIFSNANNLEEVWKSDINISTPSQTNELFRLEHAIGACRTGCEHFTSDCTDNDSSRLIEIASFKDKTTIKVTGLARSQADTCYSQGKVEFEIQENDGKKITQEVLIPCNSTQIFNFEISEESNTISGDLNATIHFSDWCTAIDELVVTGK